ncbi:LysE family translocator [Psychrosphaera aestuarii]|uniref:LysE family translocator n=1 Tax=Psychrosphaera aestuarii TaxID=1266052 RepID=UPI001B32AAB7|nr:LysE family transporter [Psychrosphaera aestuarii]
MDFTEYSIEFLTIALAHLFAVASPGPDFAIVMKHSIQYGKRTALITSVGVGSAIFVHVAYALAGIGLIINATPWLYDLLIIIAASFLIYLGIGAVQSQALVSTAAIKESSNPQLSDKKAFLLGFMTNGLNPKATLFFLSLFTVVVSIDTPMIIKGAYGVYLAFATAAWFCGLSLVLSRPYVRDLFSRNAYIFDRVMGLILILLAVNILYSEFGTRFGI